MIELQIGKVLKRLLEHKRVDLKRVSVDTKIAYTTLYSWRENRAPRDIIKVKSLADYFEVKLEYLLFDIHEDKQEQKNSSKGSDYSKEIFRGTFIIDIRSGD